MASIYSESIENRFNKKPPYYSTKRSDLLNLIPTNATHILDVGCGEASQWVGFKGEVSGIELNKEAAEKAKNNIKTVISDDVENTELPFKESYFDCILMADVLEHLYDPWGMILRLKKYLHPNGLLLISIPNVRHYSVIRSLIFKGEFNYQDSGILDIDHVRFFTLLEIKKMLTATGFKIEKVENKISGNLSYKFINKLFLNSFNHFLTEQYYIIAKKI